MKAKLGLNLNVKYEKRHCNVCAEIGDQCPQFGTLHGEIRGNFQPWSWVSKLIKSGYLSPFHPKLPIVFGLPSSSMRVSNVIVNGGKQAVAQLLRDAAGSPFSHIGVGTGTTAAAATDTGLETAITDSGLARAAATTSEVTTDVTGDTARFLKLFSVTGTKAVTESVVFNNPSGGTPLCRQVFSAINVVNGDSLQITWDIDVD